MLKGVIYKFSESKKCKKRGIIELDAHDDEKNDGQKEQQQKGI